jgi:hypothetical protein
VDRKGRDVAEQNTATAAAVASASAASVVEASVAAEVELRKGRLTTTGMDGVRGRGLRPSDGAPWAVQKAAPAHAGGHAGAQPRAVESPNARPW